MSRFSMLRLLPLLAVPLLAGCVAYPYAEGDAPPGSYVQSAPVYIPPPTVYVSPPVYYGGGYYGRPYYRGGWGGYRGWGGRRW